MLLLENTRSRPWSSDTDAEDRNKAVKQSLAKMIETTILYKDGKQTKATDRHAARALPEIGPRLRIGFISGFKMAPTVLCFISICQFRY